MKSTGKVGGRFSELRGLQANVPFFQLLHPPPSPFFCSRPISLAFFALALFSALPFPYVLNAILLAALLFRSASTGMLVMQATPVLNGFPVLSKH